MESKTLLSKSFSLTFQKVNIFLFVCTILLMLKTSAQVPYTPFPKGDILWKSCGFEYYTFDSHHFTLSIDTELINTDNKTYNKIYINDIISQKYVGGIREEDKKIYFYDYSIHNEHLIYDFGLEIGDTLIVPFFINIRVEHFGHVNLYVFYPGVLNKHLIYVAKAKDVTTLENGDYRNTLIVDRYICDFTEPDNVVIFFDATQIWVEGLGLIGGQGFFTHLDVEDFFYTPVYLKCICQNNTMLFGTNSMCCETNHINDNLRQPVSIYPNPTSGELRIENGELKINSIEIFDIYGKNIEIKKLLPNENKIDVSHLISGTYIVKITSENGVFIKKFIIK